MSGHEDLRREHEVKSSSDRSFGLVIGAAFILIFSGIIREVRLGAIQAGNFGGLHMWALGVGGLFIVVGLVYPPALAPLNKLWTKLGLLMGKVMAPIMMGLLLYTVVTPVGLLVRLFGGDPLRLKLDKKSKSYWIVRDPPGPSGDSMSNQF